MPLSSRQILAALCHANGLPAPIFEYRFHPTRRWRFDCAFEAARIAIEVDGGAFTAGRHTRGKGFIADLEKLNAAQLLGWRILRYTPKQIASGSWVEDVKALILPTDIWREA